MKVYYICLLTYLTKRAQVLGQRIGRYAWSAKILLVLNSNKKAQQNCLDTNSPPVCLPSKRARFLLADIPESHAGIHFHANFHTWSQGRQTQSGWCFLGSLWSSKLVLLSAAPLTTVLESIWLCWQHPRLIRMKPIGKEAWKKKKKHH